MLDRSTLITIINTLVFSKLFYCSSVWSNAADTNFLKLQAVQNFAARIICGTRKFDHVTSLLKELRWLPVKSQLYHHDAVLAFKCITGSAPTYISSKFLTRGEVSSRTTRSSQLLQIPLFKSRSGQRMSYYHIVSLWNSLDNSFKLCNSVLIFKRKLRANLFAAFLTTLSQLLHKDFILLFLATILLLNFYSSCINHCIIVTFRITIVLTYNVVN